MHKIFLTIIFIGMEIFHRFHVVTMGLFQISWAFNSLTRPGDARFGINLPAFLP
jgi:hypothetical protein